MKEEPKKKAFPTVKVIGELMMAVHPTVMARLGLTDGQEVEDDVMRAILEEEARFAAEQKEKPAGD